MPPGGAACWRPRDSSASSAFRRALEIGGRTRTLLAEHARASERKLRLHLHGVRFEGEVARRMFRCSLPGGEVGR
eukprot:459461-Alexandrium_andersonii.AAC.1